MLDIGPNFLFLDSFTLRSETLGISEYLIPSDDQVLQQHFVSEPRYPMSMLLEIALQSCASHIYLRSDLQLTHAIVFSSRIRAFSSITQFSSTLTTTTEAVRDRLGIVDMQAHINCGQHLIAKIEASYKI